MRLAKIIFISVLLMFPVLGFAAGIDYFGVPVPAKTNAVWTDKAIDINNINVSASYFVSDLTMPELIKFYADFFEKSDWELMNYFESQGLLSFTKDGHYMYVEVVKMGEQNAIYLINSPGDLRVCRTLAEYFLTPQISVDAEGKDLTDVPRFPGSRRRLSVVTKQEGEFVMYETDEKPEKVGDFYQENLGQFGWTQMRAFNNAILNKFNEAKDALIGISFNCFEKGEDVLIVIAYPTPKQISNSRTLITVTKNLGSLFNINSQGE